jgi:hypothetical protein
MGSRRTLWSRWKVLAQRAAEVQANVLFFLLYYIAIVPMGLLRLGQSSARSGPPGAPPVWTDHGRSPADLVSARRQF